jgi:hypothetical protein
MISCLIFSYLVKAGSFGFSLTAFLHGMNDVNDTDIGGAHIGTPAAAGASFVPKPFFNVF